MGLMCNISFRQPSSLGGSYLGLSFVRCFLGAWTSLNSGAEYYRRFWLHRVVQRSLTGDVFFIRCYYKHDPTQGHFTGSSRRHSYNATDSPLRSSRAQISCLSDNPPFLLYRRILFPDWENPLHGKATKRLCMSSLLISGH